MNRFLVYTSNLPEMPKDMKDVIAFAQETPKFYIANVELNSCLQEVKAGDQIFTKKGNSLYVIRAMENLDFDYVEKLKREYGLKNVGITSVEQVIKFETWCKSAKPIIKESIKMENRKSTLSGMSDRIKEMFMPVEAKNIRISTSGEIAVETECGYVSINSDNELVSYPEELTLDLPVYIISRPKDQLQVGDVLATGRGSSYAKVTKIDGEKISAISYTGAGKVIHTIKDFLFNQTMVRVVVSLTGMTGGQINPLMLLALSKNKESDSLLPLMMMSQTGGNFGMNPMMAYALLGDKEGSSSIKDILMLSAMTGGGMNFFGNCCPTISDPSKKPATKKVTPKKPKKTNEIVASEE